MKVKVKRFFFLVLNWAFLILYVLFIAWYRKRWAFFRNQTSYTLESQSNLTCYTLQTLWNTNTPYVLATYIDSGEYMDWNTKVKTFFLIGRNWDYSEGTWQKWKNLKNFLIKILILKLRNTRSGAMFWLVEKLRKFDEKKVILGLNLYNSSWRKSKKSKILSWNWVKLELKHYLERLRK